MQCQYCNATLATHGSLKRHQETSKKCLTLRGLPLKKQKKKLCSDPKCKTIAISGTDKCSKHGGGKRCSELGCGRGAISGTDKCIKHCGGNRCSELGCGSSAIGGTDKCSKHGGGKRCSELGCGSSAQGGTDKCSKHGGGERCSELGCGNGAQGGTDKCSKHGGGNRCSELGCGSSAQGRTDKCSKHGGGERCSELGCGNGAISGTDKCVTHGGGKRCSVLGCESSVIGSTDKCSKHGGGKRCSVFGCGSSAVGATDKCKNHGGGKRCPNCIDWIDSRCGDSKYDGYCATCFKRVFPDDSRSKVIYSNTKEIRVRNAISEYIGINKEFEGFIHDRPLYTDNCDCTHKRRIDHRKLFGNTILAIETDEFGHRGYDKYDEEIRYDDLYMIHSGKWIFIRFNPDNTRTDKTDIEDRITQLLEEMEIQIERKLKL